MPHMPIIVDEAPLTLISSGLKCVTPKTSKTFGFPTENCTCYMLDDFGLPQEISKVVLDVSERLPEGSR